MCCRGREIPWAHGTAAANLARMPRLFVVTGIPASGKSTVAKALMRLTERGVAVDGDTIRAMVESGSVGMSPDAGEEALRQLRLRHRASLAVADVYLHAGFEVAFSDNVLGRVLGELPGIVPCERFHLVVLDPAPEAIRRRDRERGGRVYTEENGAFAWLREVLETETPRIGLWLDTTNQSPDETAATVMARLEESLVPADPTNRPDR